MKGADIVVMGFSGADLDFDSDYIPFERSLEMGGTVTWVSRPGARVNPNVHALARNWPGKFRLVEEGLDDRFQTYGVDYESLRAKSISRSARPGRESAWTTSRDEIRALFGQPYLGPHACVGYCLSLLNMVGKGVEAKLLADLYESKIDLECLDPMAVTGLRALASERACEGEFVAARRWQSVAILCFETIESLLEKESDKASGDTDVPAEDRRREYASNMAVAYLSRSVYEEREGDLDSARTDLEKAEEFAEGGNNDRALGMVAYGKARVQYAADADVDAYVNALRSCLNVIRSSGYMRGVAEVLLDDCDARLMLGEYAVARDDLAECDRVLKNVGVLDLRIKHSFQSVELLLRKGRENEALQAALGLVDSIVDMAYDKWVPMAIDMVVRAFHFGSKTRVMLKRLGRLAGLDVDAIIREAEAFDDDWWGDNPPVSAWIYSRLPEDRMRAILVQGECEGDCVKSSGALHHLCVHYMKRGEWQRLLDVATCYREAASTPSSIASARYYAGCAYMELHQYEQALERFSRVTSTEGLDDDVRVGWSHIEIAKIRIILGDSESADRHYSAAFAALSAPKLGDERIAACMSYIQRLASLGRWREAAGKTEALLEDCSGEQREGLETLMALIRRSEGRGHAGGQAEEMGPEDLANLALKMLDEGTELERTWDLLCLARRKYDGRGDDAGVAKCENNMGILCEREGRYDEARDHFAESLRICEDIGNNAGAVRQLANVIMLHDHGVDVAEYVDYAERHLASYESFPERASLDAALAMECASRGMIEDASLHARRALEHPSLLREMYGSSGVVDILESYVTKVDEYYEAARGSDARRNELDEGLAEAKRLYQTGQFDASYAMLDSLREATAEDSSDRGLVEGTLGNAHLEAGRYREAADDFRKAIRLFEMAAEKDDVLRNNMLTAQNGLLLALDGSGRSGDALRELESILGDDGGDHDLSLVVNYCNRMIERSGVIEPGDKTYRRIITLLDEVDASALGHEKLGVLQHAYGILHHAAHEEGEAKRCFELARKEFLRSNSRYLTATERMLREVSDE